MAVKLMYSEKATKFCEIFTVDLSSVVPVKSIVEISQNFVAFSEFMNFTYLKDTESLHSSLLSVFGLNATSTYNSYLPLIFGKFALI